MKVARMASAVLLLLALLVTDPIRKLFPQYDFMALVLLDAAVVAIGVSAVSFRRSRVGPVPLLFSLSTSAMAVWVVTNIALVWRGAGFASLGLHTYLFYFPLAFAIPRLVGPVNVRREAQLLRSIYRFGLVCAVSVIAGWLLPIAVFRPISSGASSNLFSGDTDTVFLASGIFATGDRLARVILFPLCISVAGAVMATLQRRPQVVAALCLFALVLSARRYALGLGLAGIAVVGLYARSRISSMRRMMTLGLAGAVVAMVLAIAPRAAEYAIEGVREVPQYAAFFVSFTSQPTLLGQGAGTSSQSAGRLAAPDLLRGEAGLDRLALELGIVGLVIGLVWGIAVARMALRMLRLGVAEGSALRVGCAVYVLLLLAFSLKVQQTFGDPFSQVMFWTGVGMMRVQRVMDGKGMDKRDRSSVPTGSRVREPIIGSRARYAAASRGGVV